MSYWDRPLCGIPASLFSPLLPVCQLWWNISAQALMSSQKFLQILVSMATERIKLKQIIHHKAVYRFSINFLQILKAILIGLFWPSNLFLKAKLIGEQMWLTDVWPVLLIIESENVQIYSSERFSRFPNNFVEMFLRSTSIRFLQALLIVWKT